MCVPCRISLYVACVYLVELVSGSDITLHIREAGFHSVLTSANIPKERSGLKENNQG